MVEILIKLLISTISGSLLAIMLFLVKPWIKDRVSQKIQYISWNLVLIRMLLPFAFGVFFIGSFIPIVQVQTSETPNHVITTNQVSLEKSETHTTFDTDTKPSQMSTNIDNEKKSLSGKILLPFLLASWMLGVIIMFGLNITSYIGFSRKLKLNRRTINDNVALTIFQECCDKSGLIRPLLLYVSSCIDTPILCGIFKCYIVLPDRSFKPEQLRHAFQHELIHYRRHDNLLKWISVLAVSINWFNPLAYLTAKEAGRKCELSCDETVTASFTKDECIRYGQTLLAVASKADHKSFVLSATMSEDKRNLKERLEFIIKDKRKSRSTRIISILLLCIAIISIALTFIVSGIKKTIVSMKGDTLKSVTILHFDETQPAEPVPIKLPAATQYPKPSFAGSVSSSNPAWGEVSVIPEGNLHIDPVNPQSPPVKDFTITQCWKGTLNGEDFVLETYYDFSEGGTNLSGYCYAALKKEDKVYLTPIDSQEILVGFSGPMAIFIRPAMSYTLMPIDLESGNFVEASSDEVRSLASDSAFDPNHTPNLPLNVTGITQKVATYSACQTSSSMPNPYSDMKDEVSLKEAWEHRIGNR